MNDQTIGEVYEDANATALEAYEAAEEPTEEFEDEEVVEEEEATEDEDEGDEDVSDDDEEEEADEDDLDAGEDVEDEVKEPAPIEWDGNPSTIPDQLKPTYDNMVKGMNAKFQELAAMKRELQEQLDKAKSEPEPVEAEMPPMPTEDDSPEDYNKKWAAINAYHAEQAVKKLQAEKPDGELAEVKHALEAQRRYTKLTQTDGYSPEVEAIMVQIASENPYWQEQLQSSDDGTFALFQMAKQAVDTQSLKATAAEAAEQKVRQKVAAGKRKTTRPGGTRKASPSENFAEMGFEDLNRLALEQYEASQKK